MYLSVSCLYCTPHLAEPIRLEVPSLRWHAYEHGLAYNKMRATLHDTHYVPGMRDGPACSLLSTRFYAISAAFV